MLSLSQRGNRHLSGTMTKKHTGNLKMSSDTGPMLCGALGTQRKMVPQNRDLVKALQITGNNTSIFEGRMQDFK